MKNIELAGATEKPLVAIVHNGIGNVASVRNALRRVGAEAVVTRDQEAIKSADGVILPGVGAFPFAMDRLRGYGLIMPLEYVRQAGRPILGICLGEQLFFEASEEGEYTKGLGWIAGAVRKVLPEPAPMNVGWRPVAFSKSTELARNIEQSSFFYHLHSFAAEPDDETIVIARSEYQTKNCPVRPIVSGVEQDNLYGVQFHPEISAPYPGLELMKNFVRLCAKP